MEGGPQAGGWSESVRRLAATVSAILQNRLDLLGVEASEEKLRLLEALFLGVILLFLSLLGILVLTIGLLLLLEPPWRPWALFAFALLYLGGAFVAFLSLRRRLRHWPPPFAGTIEEIKKDLECLRTRN